ncbi:MAG TPA: M13-type metalloendopeptidase [Caulobacteraceae bacterium]|jgi:putative endopeptidase|nr:M13-type metalloendopeptidase [Caulobacteraceae bacterium]
MKQSHPWPAMLAAGVLAWSAGQAAAQSNTPAAATAGAAQAAALDVTAPRYGAWGYDQSGRDLTASPGADFFRYANGVWFDHEQIPADRTRYGNFDKLVVLSDNRTRLLIEQAAAGQLTDGDAARIGDAYKAFMDEARVERLGAAPLTPDLDAIRGESSRDDVAAVMGRAALGFQSAIFDLAIFPDAKEPGRYAVYIDLGGLGLPDRDYYLKPEFAEKKAAYQAYVATLLKEIGWADPDAAARAVVDFETRLADISWSRAEERDPYKTYNPMAVADLATYAPGFDFRDFLAAAELGSIDHIVLESNTAFPKAAAIYAATPVETLKAWQAFHLVDAAAPYLPDRFVEDRFNFRNHVLAGQPEIQPRWKRGVGFIDRTLGEAVGRLYVARYFTPDAKAKMDALVGNLKAALNARLDQVDWMSAETKSRAQEKLARLSVKIGYPARWRDYSALSIRPDDLYGDAERAEAFDWERQVRRMAGPVDKLEWAMTPQTVNAYYNPSNNEIVFPAAILSPPFFDPAADPAINYGGIGAVIGHEMTHGFDDQGRKFDGDGRLADWWSAGDASKFQVRADRLGAQYSAFEPVPGAHIKGDLTMGENIADLGGVLLALDAYHASLHGQPAPVIDGLTGDQRFFLGFAQIWREKIRDDTLREDLVSDRHSPSHYRVVGTLRNVDAWYQAFDVKPADPMYVPPDQRVRIW